MKTIRYKLSSTTFIITLFFALFSSCSVNNFEDIFKSPGYEIKTDVDSLVFTEAGGSQTLTLNTNAQWQINTSSDWVSFTPTNSPDGAASNQNITITVPAYTSFATRKTTISIKSGVLSNDNVNRKFITIVQHGPVKPDREPGIWTKQDWIDFAAKVSGSQDYSLWQDTNGDVNLRADIDFGSDLIPCAGGQSVNNTIVNPEDNAFAGKFNGNNFTIKGTLDGGTKQIIALFTRLAPTGIIVNLKVNINASSTYASTNGHLATLVGFIITATTGYISNCISSGSLSTDVGGSVTRVGGMVAYGRCNITDCVSNTNINAACTRMGGIFGAGGGSFIIKNCTNNGIIYSESASVQAGGIIGQLNGQTILGCTNNAKISATANAATLIGGIAGSSQGTSAIGDMTSAGICINNGEIALIKASLDPNNASAGGISGGVSAATVTITNCNNKGKVNSTVDNALVNVGGIVGQMTAAGAINSCTNAVNTDIISAQNAGGIVGRATATATITSCTNSGNIKMLESATIATKGTFIGGIIGVKGTATYTGCTYGGTVLGVAGSAGNAEGK